MKSHQRSQTLMHLPIGQLMDPLKSPKHFLVIHRGPQSIALRIRLCIEH